MILLDTHIWVWWVHDAPELSKNYRDLIEANEGEAVGVSAISCWEIAKLVELKRIELPCAIDDWFYAALSYPGVHLFGLTPEVAIESTRLPGEFHRDPADQIIVATARVHNLPLLTADERILKYPHVRTLR